MRALRSLLLGGLLAGLATIAGCYASTGTGYGTYGYTSYGAVAVTTAPPAPADVYYESRDGHVWVQGRWVWSGSQWLWRPGYWQRDRPGYVYIDGYWDYRGSQYIWVDGYWSRHRPGYTYISGYWEPSGGSYVWVRGRWEADRPGHVYVRGRWTNDGGRRVYRPGYWGTPGRSRVVDQRDSRPTVERRDGGSRPTVIDHRRREAPRAAPTRSDRSRVIDHRGGGRRR